MASQEGPSGDASRVELPSGCDGELTALHRAWMEDSRKRLDEEWARLLNAREELEEDKKRLQEDKAETQARIARLCESVDKRGSRLVSDLSQFYRFVHNRSALILEDVNEEECDTDGHYRYRHPAASSVAPIAQRRRLSGVDGAAADRSDAR